METNGDNIKGVKRSEQNYSGGTYKFSEESWDLTWGIRALEKD